MSLSIEELTRHPQLGVTYLAGRSGGSRAVLWAHTCELPEPWQWLGAGDLLLTDGYSFPADGVEQAAFIQQLASSGLSGLMLAEGLRAAPLTTQAAAAADALDFPVLQAAYEIPFISVARTVAESNSHDISRRLHRLLRIYDLVRGRSAAASPEDGLVAQMADEIECDLSVLDLVSGRTLLPHQTMVAERVLREVGQQLAERPAPLPAFSRVTADQVTAMVLPLRERSHVALVAVARHHLVAIDLAVLQHVATIASVEVDRGVAAQLRRRRKSTQTFAKLVEGVLDDASASAEIAHHGLAAGPWVVVAVETGVELDVDELHAELEREGLACLLLPSEGGVTILVRPGSVDHTVLSRVMGLHVVGPTHDDLVLRTGFSREVSSPRRIPDAVRESRWALETAHAEGRSCAIYGDHVPMFMPSTLAEGEAVVARVLGELLQYDVSPGAHLMDTLGAYLDANRSTQRCAAVLGVHKQTVVYRLRRIEALTGRRLQDVGDLSALFFAYKTWRLLSTEALVRGETLEPRGSQF